MRNVIIKEKVYNRTTKDYEDLPERKGKFHEWGKDARDFIDKLRMDVQP